jgi:hypothetical protein
LIVAVDTGQFRGGIVVLSTNPLLNGPRGEVPSIVYAKSQATIEEILDWVERPETSTVVCEWFETYRGSGKKKGALVGQSTFFSILDVGRIKQAAFTTGCPFHLISRPLASYVLCETRRTTEPEMHLAIKESYYPQTGGGSRPWKGVKDNPGPLYLVAGHAWSALSVGLAYWCQEGDCQCAECQRQKDLASKGGQEKATDDADPQED